MKISSQVVLEYGQIQAKLVKPIQVGFGYSFPSIRILSRTVDFIRWDMGLHCYNKAPTRASFFFFFLLFPPLI